MGRGATECLWERLMFERQYRRAVAQGSSKGQYNGLCERQCSSLQPHCLPVPMHAMPPANCLSPLACRPCDGCITRCVPPFRLPGDERTMVGFLTFDNTLHFYNLKVRRTVCNQEAHTYECTRMHMHTHKSARVCIIQQRSSHAYACPLHPTTAPSPRCPSPTPPPPQSTLTATQMIVATELEEPSLPWSPHPSPPHPHPNPPPPISPALALPLPHPPCSPP